MVHQGQLVLVGDRGHLCGRRGNLGRHFGGVHRWLVPCAFLVRPQACELRVRALTHLALVRPLARVQPDVDAHVGAQVAAGVEPAVANDAAHARR